MIAFDLHLGFFSILFLRETVPSKLKLTRDGLDEVILDLPKHSVIFTKHIPARRTAVSQ